MSAHLSQRHAAWRARTLAPAFTIALLAGCVHYQPKPLTPAGTLATIGSRSLDDPQLKAFLEANQVHVTEAMHWDLHALTLLAFYFHPDLDEARAAADVARAGIRTAGERPNPQLQAALGVDTTTGPPWIPALGLLIPIETAGKRGIRIAEAKEKAQAAQLRIVDTAWKVRVRVRRALVDYVAARRLGDILSRQLTLQDQIVDIVQRQFEAGAVSPFELARARLAAANGRLALDQSRFQLALSGAALVDAVGLPPPSFDRLAASVDAGDVGTIAIPDAAAQRQALVSRADVLAALSDYEATQAALQTEIAKQYPDIQLGPGYQYDQTDNKWTLGVNVNLPVFNRNLGAIGEANARREQAAAHVVVIQAAALHDVNQAVTTLAAARQKLATAQAALDASRQQEQRTQTQYDLGELSRPDVLTSQLEVVAAEIALAEAQLQADSTAGALEDAMQSPLGLEKLVLTNPRSPSGGGGPRS
jgi:cobalt-zinc-cadmium efflux system outer membrane protein